MVLAARVWAAQPSPPAAAERHHRRQSPAPKMREEAAAARLRELFARGLLRDPQLRRGWSAHRAFFDRQSRRCQWQFVPFVLAVSAGSRKVHEQDGPHSEMELVGLAGAGFRIPWRQDHDLLRQRQRFRQRLERRADLSPCAHSKEFVQASAKKRQAGAADFRLLPRATAERVDWAWVLVRKPKRSALRRWRQRERAIAIANCAEDLGERWEQATRF